MSRVSGQAALGVIEVKLLKLPADLSKQVEKELHKVSPKVSEAIRDEVPSHVPVRGGYAATLRAAMRFKWVAKAGKGMTGVIWADGKRDRRDLRRIDSFGIVRHPTFGRRTGPKDWHNQTKGVRKGLVGHGVDKAQPLIVRAIEKAADTAADNVVR